MRGVEVVVLDRADKSDPLNEMVIVGARIKNDGKLVAAWRGRSDYVETGLERPRSMARENAKRKAIEAATTALIESVLEYPDGDPQYKESV